MVGGRKQKAGKSDPEFELIDTGIFNEQRYFDVFIEYAKADENDILIKISIHNRGPEEASLHVLPQLWFRNTWAWGYDSTKPEMYRDEQGVIKITHQQLGNHYLFAEGDCDALFCENETNTQRLYNYPGQGTFKDGINDFYSRK